MSQTEKNYEVIDKNVDKQSGELESFLLLWEGAEPELKSASPENVLLYIHELYEFLNGGEGIVLSKDPKVMVAPTGAEYSYIINVKGHVVETTPNQAEDVLEGVKQAVEDGKISKIRNVHRNIVKNQVRKNIINALKKTFSSDERARISVVENGWLIDNFFLVNWEASMYTRDDDPEETDYRRSGGVVETDKSYEFVQLRQHNSLDPVSVKINGTTYELTEREMLFLSKVKWLLYRENYHADRPFWLYVHNYAERQGVTDVTEMDDDERDDKFMPNF